MEGNQASQAQLERRNIRVSGIVQGVGFRPFVYGLAQRFQLSGLVGNDSGGVFIEIEGLPQVLNAFQRELRQNPPSLARIEEIVVEDAPTKGDEHFVIVASERREAASTMVSPDACVCEACLSETLDPDDRRFRYPFTNCTNCGPRFTIIQDIPYDRPLTTMAPFEMCARCQAEYDDPLDRRFHAQPNACPDCGPRLKLELQGNRLEAETAESDPIEAAQRLLQVGGIVAIKGLGGFHLACDATNDAAVARLRERKGREHKPFAVMAADMDAVRSIARVNEDEERLLGGIERPIVLLRAWPDSSLSQLVAPANPLIGVMLPYTPLHALLFMSEHKSLRTLIMTSANYSNEPIIKDNQEAQQRLAGVADALLLHNRAIEMRCDDSVMRVWRGKTMPIRRSRGFAPLPLRLPEPMPPVLAVGGELKATFCLTKENQAYMSQHVGDMENLETMEAFERAIAHYKQIFRVEPQIIACDMHPEYLSSRWALDHAHERRVVRVQHHHAHLAAVMAEHGVDPRAKVLGFSFDGTGYGPDGTIWGGEVLRASYGGFDRLAHLKTMPLPGGDAAIKRPYRLALAYLWFCGIPWDERLPPVAACPAQERDILRRQLETGLNVVPTSSAGRLFDVVSSLAGVRQEVTYEGQAAIELEALAVAEDEEAYEFSYSKGEIDPLPLLDGVVTDVLAGTGAGIISMRLHRAMAKMIVRCAEAHRTADGPQMIALSGGVFQNLTLLESAVAGLEDAGFQPLVHQVVPANDGGLALGQAMIAAYSGADE